MLNKTFSQIFAFCLIAPLLLSSNYANANNSANTAQQKPQLTITPIATNVFQHVSYKEVENYGMVPANG